MQQILAYGIVGLSTAAIYAIIGSGLVLTYTTTGVFNFAQGAVGMLAAFTYWQLTIGWGWPVPVALAVVLLVLAPAFGLLVERVLMRPVQGLGEAQRLVVTVALLSGLIATARWIWNPNLVRALPPFFPSAASLRLGPATITWHQAITMIVAVLVAAGLWAVLHRTRTGAEMRAVVDDRALAGLMGADPVRANRVAWILGTQMAAVGGILIAPELTLDATQLSLLIVSAYTAAVFGRLRSLPLTFAGAVVVGGLESYLTGYLPPNNDLLIGLRLAAPPRPAAAPGPGTDHARDGRLRRGGRRVRRGAGLGTEQRRSHRLRSDLLARHRGAVLRPAGRLRGPDLAVPAQHGGDRRDRLGARRSERAVVGAGARGRGLGRGRRADRGARAAPVRHLPGPGDRRLRGRLRPVDLQPALVPGARDPGLAVQPRFGERRRPPAVRRDARQRGGPDGAGRRLPRPALARGGGAAARQVRPAADRAARQRGRLRDARRQPAGGHGGARRGAVRDAAAVGHRRPVQPGGGAADLPDRSGRRPGQRGRRIVHRDHCRGVVC